MALVHRDQGVHLMLREQFKKSQPDWVLEYYPNGETAIAQLATRTPELILMEAGSGGLCGIQTLRRLRTAAPSLPVVMFASSGEPREMFLSLMAGANGYLISPVSSVDFARALCVATSGATVLCQNSQNLLAASFRGGHLEKWQAAQRSLSRREEQLLSCLFQRLFDKEIAALMDISKSTVHSHCAHLFAKLGVRSRNEAVGKYLGMV